MEWANLKHYSAVLVWKQSVLALQKGSGAHNQCEWPHETLLSRPPSCLISSKEIHRPLPRKQTWQKRHLSPLSFVSLGTAMQFLRESVGMRKAYSHCNTPGREARERRDTRNSSLRPVSDSQRKNLISWQQKQKLVFTIDYVLEGKEQGVFGKHTRSQCNNASQMHSPSFHYWLQVSFFFFFSFRIHLLLLSRVWRKPSAVVTSVTFPASQQRWAVAEISSPMFSRHLCCSSASDSIRGLVPTPPDSSRSRSSERACALFPLLSKAGFCSLLFNCLRKWQIVWYRHELWASNLPTDALVGKHSSASPFMVVWRCSHLSSSRLHLALTTGLCLFRLDQDHTSSLSDIRHGRGDERVFQGSRGTWWGTVAHWEPARAAPQPHSFSVTFDHRIMEL